MSQLESVVIVGGGQAAGNAAFALRERGYDGRLTIVGDEPLVPYERPPLSKEYLRGEKPIEKAYVRPATDYETADIELLLDRSATAVDPRAQRVALGDGAILDYDALLLATGSRPRRLDVPGADLAGVYYLRTAADSEAIRAAAAASASVVVIGSGWIGSEVAASLTQLGSRVTMVGRGDRPLEHVLGAQIGEVYRQVHAENGVRIVRGEVSEIVGAGSVSGVRLADGELLEADLVVAGVGALPRTELAEAAGLALRSGGIQVDELLATTVSGIFAAGDVAAAWHPRYREFVRVEHWDNAKRQGRAAAASILGSGEPYRRTPYFYSDQFDLGMEYRGRARRWDEVVIRGSVEERRFHAFWLAERHVVAAMNVNLWDDGDALLAIVESGTEIDSGRLADTSEALAAVS